jgi:hypothetical protein
VYRHRTTRALSAESLDGRDVDLATGNVVDRSAPPRATAEWQLVLEPGVPVLELWLPGNTLVTVPEIVRSVLGASVVFARLAPETVPAAVVGESWRLDPQVLTALPEQLGLHSLQRVCGLYPSAVSEAKSLRRLFGPDTDRAAVARLDSTALDPLRRGVAALLTDPRITLRARGGFVLRDDLQRLAGKP